MSSQPRWLEKKNMIANLPAETMSLGCDPTSTGFYSEANEASPEGLALSAEDRSRLRRLTSEGARGVLREVLIASRFSVLGTAGALHEALARGDVSTVVRESRRLESVAEEVGARRLAEIAREFQSLEPAGWDGTEEKLLDEVARELEAVLHDVDGLLA